MTSLVPIIIFLIRALLATILVAAGAAKLVDLVGFTATLSALGMPAVRKLKIHPLALAISLLELALGLALGSGLWPIVINTAVLVLMIGFSAVVLVALHRTPNVSCRCFGALSDTQFSGRGLVRGLLLTALAVVVFWYGFTSPLPLMGPLTFRVLIFLGYLVFAVAAAQAAQTLATVKERVFS
jgi:hypothetical protein